MTLAGQKETNMETEATEVKHISEVGKRSKAGPDRQKAEIQAKIPI